MASPDNTPRRRFAWRWVIVFVGLLTVFGCCVVPGFACRPAVDVNTFHPDEGMTMDEMRSKYGNPTEVSHNSDGTATWFYSTDRLGLGVFVVGVNFDTGDRVKSTFNH